MSIIQKIMKGNLPQSNTKLSAKFIKGLVGEDQILVDGTRQIAFVGRSNVGKSSLLNFLFNSRSMVKTSSTPGKTQQLNVFSVNEGQVYFVDLPGYGYAKLSQTDREKIRKRIVWYITEIAANHGATIVLVTDVKVGLTDLDHQMLSLLQEYKVPLIVVANKIDKLNQKDLYAKKVQLAQDLPDETPVVYTSVLKRRGHDNLLTILGL